VSTAPHDKPTRASTCAYRRSYAQDTVTLLTPVEVPLDAEHARRALIALAELLAPLFRGDRPAMIGEDNQLLEDS